MTENLSKYNSDIKNIEVIHNKAKTLLGYDPKYSVKQGLEEGIEWYWEYFNKIKQI